MSYRLNRARGVSLVEVLVALVVLSVGLLGVAALLVTSVQGTRTALYRTNAINLVSDMADRIRANAVAGAAYAGNGVAADCQTWRTDADVERSTNCTPAQLAADDVDRWRSAIRDTFPRVSGTIPSGTVQFFAGTPTTPQRYRITVAWQEPSSNQSGALDAYTHSTEVVMLARQP
jgi:type IV pilus assembly protein PilV